MYRRLTLYKIRNSVRSLMRKMTHPKVKYQRMDNRIDIETGDREYSMLSTSRNNSSCLYQCIRTYACLLVGFFDFIVSAFLQFMFCVYRKVAKRYPLFIEEHYGFEIGDLRSTIYNLNGRKNDNTDEIRILKDEIDEKSNTIQRLEIVVTSEKNRYAGMLKDRDSRIQILTKEKLTIEDEKQDALKRLSEVVSANLRDNNPNIVDLNDQCRPTKLAEMFSELYDNEWTDAFGVLEEVIGEKHAIVVLLDILISAYEFSEEIVAGPWNVLNEWFLDMKLPGALQTSKWLKDSRKANVKNKVPHVRKEYEQMVLSRCNQTDVTNLLTHESTQCYITKCIEICLLMVTTDPPVVLECPERAVGIIDSDKDGKQQNVETMRETDVFKKDLYKEYTLRGEYLDYIVWPALHLHEEGPLLCKGIAQGTAEKRRIPETWTWRKVYKD